MKGLVEAALGYAAQGWKVFPVNPTDKAPLTAHGFHDATTAAEKIRAWWDRWPEASVGLVPGPEELVLDVDRRAGGDATLADLTRRLGPLPPTVKSLTGGGGEHYLLRVPQTTRLPKQLGLGLDLKGCATGYVIVPPSIHRSGNAYRWAPYCSPGEQLVAPLPAAWLDEIRRATNGDGTGPAARLPAQIHEGEGRNNALTSLAGSMRRRGATEAEILAALGVANASRCRPPLADKEVLRIAGSVVRYPAADNTGTQEEPGREKAVPKLVTLCNVKPESVSWLWPGRVPFGKLTVLDGDPGLGKSMVTLDIAARLTSGRPFPDGAGCELASVVLLSAEDGLADTIRPRLDAVDADSSRVVAVPVVVVPGGAEILPNIAAHLPQIEEALRKVSARLLVVDPLMAYLGREINSYRDQDVRGVLAPLAVLAERTEAAVLLVRHLRKGSRADGALYAGGGSIGIAGAARSVLLVAKDPDDEGRRILAAVKSNLCRTPPSLAYRIEEDREGRPRVAWESDSVEITADRLLAAAAEGAEDRTAREEVAERLREILSGGPVPEKEVCAELGVGRGVSERTYRRARQALGVVSAKAGFGAGWSLRLPEDCHDGPKTANGKGWQPSRDAGSLRACSYHVGPQGGPCQRCGRTFAEHVPGALSPENRRLFGAHGDST